MTHHLRKYGGIYNFSGVIYVFIDLEFVGTWAPANKIIGDIPDFIVLNVPIFQPLQLLIHAGITSV